MGENGEKREAVSQLLQEKRGKTGKYGEKRDPKGKNGGFFLQVFEGLKYVR